MKYFLQNGRLLYPLASVDWMSFKSVRTSSMSYLTTTLCIVRCSLRLWRHLSDKENVDHVCSNAEENLFSKQKFAKFGPRKVTSFVISQKLYFSFSTTFMFSLNWLKQNNNNNKKAKKAWKLKQIATNVLSGQVTERRTVTLILMMHTLFNRQWNLANFNVILILNRIKLKYAFSSEGRKWKDLISFSYDSLIRVL